MRFVALLRGINVGGNTMIKMDELKAVFSELGFENVGSYINSGNLAFDTKKANEEKLVSRLEAAIESKFNKQVPVMVRDQIDISRIIDANPFAGQFESHKYMHALFLTEPLPNEKVKLLAETDFGDERLAVIDREIYVLMPNGLAESVFCKKAILDKSPKVLYTARNWRTVEKLAEL